MFGTVEIPVWLLTLILLFAGVTFASHFLFPSVRWFLRRRAEKLVAELNKRLERPIEPFKLARRTDTIQRLIYHPDIARAVAEHTRTTGLREDVAFEEARRYAREIVPGFSATAYFRFATRAARRLSTTLYHVRVGQADTAGHDKIDPDATVVYVMNHRSNMDYVLATYLVAERSALAYAVGEWARVWPLGPLIRSLGGYFIRRRSRNPLYRSVLKRYVQMATAAGVTQAVFPEGGLSQDGRIGTPRLGLLSYLVEDADLAARDVVFVPVALNYDRVVEDRILIEARRKGERRFRGTFRSASAFAARYAWRRLTGRAQRFGEAAVSFGAPLSLRNAARSDDVPALARELMRRIARATPVLSVPLAAWAFLGADGPLSRDAIAERVAAVAARLRDRGATLLIDPDLPRAIEQGLGHLRLRKLIQDGPGGMTVAPGQADLVAFYAASVQEVLDASAETARRAPTVAT